jgi:hypothetical protein
VVPSKPQQTSETGDVLLLTRSPLYLHAVVAQRQSSLVVASVHKSSSARSAWTFRQTAKMPSPTKASSSSFFTVRTLHIACESLDQAL